MWMISTRVMDVSQRVDRAMGRGESYFARGRVTEDCQFVITTS